MGTGSKGLPSAMSLAKLTWRRSRGMVENCAALKSAQKDRLRQRKCAPQRADDETFETGVAERRGDLGIDLCDIDRDHDRRAGILDLMRDLAFDIERVEIDDDTAGFQNGEIADDGIGRVGQTKTDARAAPHAEQLEAARGARDEPAQCRIGQTLAEEIGCRPIAKARDALVEEIEERNELEGRALIGLWRHGPKSRACPGKVARFSDHCAIVRVASCSETRRPI